MTAAPHVLFAGGGAAGHLFPGFAVAEHLLKSMPGVEVTFAGSGRARERHVVRTAGYRYTPIPAQPAPQSPMQALRYVTDNVAGFCAARWMLREQKVSLVVSLGGHASAAAVNAATARGVPVVLLEQNATPSRMTRRLSQSNATICAAFDEIRPHLHVQSTVSVTGNPARPAFEQLYYGRPNRGVQLATSPESTGHEPGAPVAARIGKRQKRLVVLGGAGGARSLNEQMPLALKRLGDQLEHWQIVHQTGEGQLSETETRYRKMGVDALVVAFIDEIASVMFASDLVVCRASGTTLAELALAGAPALLVPFPMATDDHQTANAKVATTAGGARLIDETSQTGALDAALARDLETLLVDDKLRASMSEGMRKLARPRASAEIAEVVCEHLCGPVRRLAA